MNLRYLSVSQLSEVTGKDRRTVSKRLAGVEPHEVNGRATIYDAHHVIGLILASESVSGMDKKLLAAELGVEEARQAKLEIEVARLRGELIPLEEVAKAVETEYSYVRAQIRQIPSKMAKPLSTVTDPNIVYTQLQEAVDELLAELVADASYNEKLEKLNAAITPEAEIETPAHVAGETDSEELPE